MNELAPLEMLYDPERGTALPLPPQLAALYGRLQFPPHAGRPYVIANFVTSLDGVVALGIPGHEGGGEISGFNQHDRMLMGILRAAADAVIVGAGTLRGSPRHLWTAGHIYPPLAEVYQLFRTNLGKSKPPLNVIVTARGEVDLELPVFQSGKVDALIVTTADGAREITAQRIPPSVRLSSVTSLGRVGAKQILDAVVHALGGKSDLILVEGGPQLMGDFLGEHVLDELFLTIAPQVAGRESSAERPGFIAGKRFAPEQPLWGTLTGAKRAASHLFLRYSFEASAS